MSSARRGSAWMVPLSALAGVGVLSLAEHGAHLTSVESLLALLIGGGIPAAWKITRRHKDAPRELRRRAQANVRELNRVAREDPVAAPQMKRLAALQGGLLESWELLPEEYRPLLDDDVHTIMGEVEGAARLALRRAALRRHLESLDRREISRRVKGLERDIASLEAGSPLRTSFESALASRREELAGYEGILEGISAVNARLEGVESLLGNLRGELLSLDTDAPHVLDSSDLARLKERVAYFRRSLDEMTKSVETLHENSLTEPVR